MASKYPAEKKKSNARLYKEKPLASISISEFEKPGNDYLVNLRRFCISFGLISPGESRIGIVHIMDLLLRQRQKKRDGLDSYEIMKALYSRNIRIVYANVLRDLRKLVGVGLVERKGNYYRIRENLPLKELISDFVQPYIINKILGRINEYAEAIDKSLTAPKAA